LRVRTHLETLHTLDNVLLCPVTHPYPKLLSPTTPRVPAALLPPGKRAYPSVLSRLLPISKKIRRPLFLLLDLAVASLERSTSHRLPQRQVLPAPLPRRAIAISIASHAARLLVHHGVTPVNRSRNHLPPTSRHLPPTSRQLLEAGRWQ
jgi:hypothetical protein